MVLGQGRLPPPAGSQYGAGVRFVSCPAELDQVLALDGLVFEEPAYTEAQRQDEWQRLASGQRRIAFWPGADGVARSAGVITRRTGWALLSGGETHPACRGRGLYTAVLERRLQEAAEWGAGFVAVRATPGTSQPILERRGFRTVAQVTRYRPGQASGGAARGGG